jgi:hypothetical protein
MREYWKYKGPDTQQICNTERERERESEGEQGNVREREGERPGVIQDICSPPLILLYIKIFLYIFNFDIRFR